jgi:PAS domain S-box-containing protein
VGDGIAITAGTERVFVNRAFLAIHGLPDISQALGLPLDHFIVPEDREAVDRLVLLRQKGEPLDNPVEYRILRSDGEMRTLQAVVTLVNFKGRQAALTVLRDVTPLKQAETKILRLNEELEKHVRDLAQANAELEVFNSTVSHDLRIPLMAIDGFSRRMAEKCSDTLDEKGRSYLSMIRASVTRMGKLIEDLLAYSRLGRREMHHSPVSMQEIVASVLNELRTIYPEGEVLVSPLPECIGDERLLRQVITNLLSNAFKFSKYRAHRIIEVKGWEEADENVYSVTDNGAGFDMQYKDKLFNVFERLHSYQEFEGTGIGLSIVKRIVERHGGRIWAEGKPDEGATFYFSLPPA